MLSERRNQFADQKTERGKVLNPEYSIDRDQPTSRASPLRINTLLSTIYWLQVSCNSFVTASFDRIEQVLHSDSERINIVKLVLQYFESPCRQINKKWKAVAVKREFVSAIWGIIFVSIRGVVNQHDLQNPLKMLKFENSGTQIPQLVGVN